MDGTTIAKSALQLLETVGKTIADLNLHPVVTLAARAASGAATVALSAIDNASKSEAETLAALKATLASSIAAVDQRLGDLDAARKAADDKIAAAAPPEQSAIAAADLVADAKASPGEVRTED